MDTNTTTTNNNTNNSINKISPEQNHTLINAAKSDFDVIWNSALQCTMFPLIRFRIFKIPNTALYYPNLKDNILSNIDVVLQDLYTVMYSKFESDLLELQKRRYIPVRQMDEKSSESSSIVVSFNRENMYRSLKEEHFERRRLFERVFIESCKAIESKVYGLVLDNPFFSQLVISPTTDFGPSDLKFPDPYIVEEYINCIRSTPNREFCRDMIDIRLENNRLLFESDTCKKGFDYFWKRCYCSRQKQDAILVN